jgi:hypothetical protein
VVSKKSSTFAVKLKNKNKNKKQNYYENGCTYLWYVRGTEVRGNGR